MLTASSSSQVAALVDVSAPPSRIRPAVERAGRSVVAFFKKLAAPTSASQKVIPLRALAAAEGFEPRPKTEASTILAVGAHPDDVEIGCGGTLALHAARGDRVIILTLCAGEQAGHPGQRATESSRAAERIGAELVLEQLDDTRIPEGPATISAIERVVRAVSPDVVYVHTEQDRHQDHRNVHRAAMVATRNVPSVYCYQSPSTTTAFQPTRFVPIDEQLQTKLELLALYDSQSSTKGYLAPRLIEATAVYWGRFAGAGVVEPYEVVRERQEIR